MTLAEINRMIRAAREAGDEDLAWELEEELDAVVYRCFDDSGTLLYVGVSLNPLQRLMQHKETARWFDQVARIEIKRYSSRVLAQVLEARAIRNENPLRNVVGRVA